ncbi:Tim44/TimA family putative adaptor protein [Jiella sp. MQZ9-1]|uniref:Tim44 domain-containing protein n=1 Tax=Jiella flava TaxID=2816857 RepID=A0A939JWG2_9HYPH|nr:Tim44/TimA family putative adaptor protein [Jiella flava]MBO0663484.1 Tim44 domain-containing protein [Jiella flava]MCD2472059.1 Tim44/TimA family putative adaptor protein [Jiella flava]
MGLGTIILVVIAAVVLFQLRNVLGRRTGNERPPFDPYSRPDTPREEAASNGNVVTLPQRRAEDDEGVPARVLYEKVDKVAVPGSPLNAELRKIRDVDTEFDPVEFLDGAKVAYEMVVNAFADGDRRLLKGLLSSEVYADFDKAIAEREAAGQTMNSSFIGIDEAKLVAAELKGREAQLTVRFVSQLISATLGPNSEVVDGDPEAVVEVRDVWIFARDTRSRDPNWKLVGTESDEA